jgi:ribosomal protein L7/L12
MLNRLLLPVLKAFLVILDKVFMFTRKKGVPLYPYDKRTQAINLPKKVEQQLQELIADDNKVEAIRQVTRLTGAGLRVSKDYVDRLDWKNRSRKYKRQRSA